MGTVDPRETYDDLVLTTTRRRVPPEQFAEAADSEPADSGWVVLGIVRDDADRILLVDQPWADGWKAPGGARQPGESLTEAVVREVREETGIECAPVRPHGIDDWYFENEHTGDTCGWAGVFFEAVAETTAIDADPGLEDERIDDAAWFDGLPENVYNRELHETVYRRCVDGSTPV